MKTKQQQSIDCKCNYKLLFQLKMKMNSVTTLVFHGKEKAGGTNRFIFNVLIITCTRKRAVSLCF